MYVIFKKLKIKAYFLIIVKSYVKVMILNYTNYINNICEIRKNSILTYAEV